MFSNGRECEVVMKIVVLMICILTGYVNEKEIVRVVRRDESHVRLGG